MYQCIFPHLVQTSASTHSVAGLCIFKNVLEAFPSKFKKLLNIERVRLLPNCIFNKQQLAERKKKNKQASCFTTPSDDRTRREGACDRGTDASSDYGWRVKERMEKKRRAERASRWPWCENKPDKSPGEPRQPGADGVQGCQSTPKQAKHPFLISQW